MGEEAACSLAGGHARSSTAGGARVVLGADASVILCDAVDEPGVSGVWSGQLFRLMGPASAVVRARMVDESDGPLPVHLFVRVFGGCRYLGVGRPVYSSCAAGELLQCDLRIEPPLAPEVLDEVRPTGRSPQTPSLDWLTRLGEDRVRALGHFATGWYPRPGLAPAAPGAVPADLPRALREFYRLAYQRPGMLGGQNRILPATELRPGADPRRVVFGEENQLCFHWELDPAEVDPVVWLTAAEDSAEREPLSGFLMQFSLFEAMAGAPYLAQAWYPPVPSRSYRTSPTGCAPCRSGRGGGRPTRRRSTSPPASSHAPVTWATACSRSRSAHSTAAHYGRSVNWASTGRPSTDDVATTRHHLDTHARRRDAGRCGCSPPERAVRP
ncbi:hypothetical protein [Streptomyces sp. CoH27]|uniref:hypothetical protein n=1 Tax=Streptomyces sp. CoH27 TaxID=2875763 RepID=UPI001CD4AA3D|nr:hypothetical protein [Streptomyces sp. CoH27]